MELRIDLAGARDRVADLLFNVRLHLEIDGDIEHLRTAVEDLFGRAPDVLAQRFHCAGGLEGLLVYDKGLVNQQLLVLGLLDRLVASSLTPADGHDPHILHRIAAEVAPTGAVSEPGDSVGHGQTRLADLASQVLGGAAVFAFAGCPRVMAVKVDQAPKRGIGEPPSSPTVMGPHEGFIEDASTNLAMLRRRLPTPRLRVEEYRMGQVSRTSVYLLSMQGITEDRVVAEARRRMARIRVDAILESNMLMELIRDAPGSPVPTIQRSERPDRVAGALLQGQFAIMVDGTPFVLLAPTTLGRLLKATEDYYQNWIVSSLIRGVRLMALLLGVFLPGLYVAIVTYNPEFVPTPLLVVLAESRENVPLPSLAEVLLLLLLFEIIREAGARVPQGIGSALTIGGTLVVGQAAVRAGIVSSPIIIITAAVVIAFFAIPAYDLVQTSRFLLYPMLLAAGVLGLFGMAFVAIGLALYLTSLRSFGVPFLAPVAPMMPRDWKDSLVRAPWWAMDTRPQETGDVNPVRQNPGQKPRTPGDLG